MIGWLYWIMSDIYIHLYSNIEVDIYGYVLKISKVCVIPLMRPWTRLLLCSDGKVELCFLLNLKPRKQKEHAIRFPEAKSRLPESQNRSKFQIVMQTHPQNALHSANDALSHRAEMPIQNLWVLVPSLSPSPSGVGTVLSKTPAHPTEFSIARNHEILLGTLYKFHSTPGLPGFHHVLAPNDVYCFGLDFSPRMPQGKSWQKPIKTSR